MKRKLTPFIFICSVSLLCACSDDKAPQTQTHVEIVQEALKEPLCEVTKVSLSDGKTCSVRIQHKFIKVNRDSYEVQISSIDDCLHTSIEDFKSDFGGVQLLATKDELNSSLFNKKSTYYLDFNISKTKAKLVSSSTNQITEVYVLRNPNESTSITLAPEDSSNRASTLSQQECSQINPEIQDFCSRFKMNSLGYLVKNLDEIEKNRVKSNIYNELFQKNICGADSRTELYNEFLMEGEY